MADGIAAVAAVQRHGWDAHVLDTDGTTRGLLGMHVHPLADFTPPPAFRVPNLYEPSRADFSDGVRLALERLHAEHHFDVIEFGVSGGLGFRTVQAKRAGLAFGNVVLAARLNACSRAERERACRWPAGLDELEADFAERYAFESADVRRTPEPVAAEYVRSRGWSGVVNPAADPIVAYGAALPERSSGVESPARTPLVTVGVAYYNLGQYLPETLATIAAQTYDQLEVLVIDDGSTDPDSIRVFAEEELKYPRYRFLRQANAGIGATRNRCLAEARGEFFVPMDADNLARPDMVERFVRGIERNPHLGAMTCYFLAFDDAAPKPAGTYLFACRPVGGPHAAASMRNVYGDATAIFRTADFRAAGGYGTDRGTSNEDWEAFVKLVNRGGRIGVIPDHLFDYRHRAGGFSRVTDGFANHQRVLCEFARADRLPPGEGDVLWAALLGFQQEVERLTARQQCRRYKIADRLHAAYRRATAPARALARLTRRS